MVPVMGSMAMVPPLGGGAASVPSENTATAARTATSKILTAEEKRIFEGVLRGGCWLFGPAFGRPLNVKKSSDDVAVRAERDSLATGRFSRATRQSLFKCCCQTGQSTYNEFQPSSSSNSTSKSKTCSSVVSSADNTDRSDRSPSPISSSRFTVVQ